VEGINNLERFEKIDPSATKYVRPYLYSLTGDLMI
jgi:hypothetical protein